ncbi:MAG: hypothetical protein IT353_02580 [Gemmatimonadaceae bacterium]|nr:hypothetical protein [Gemmatimonadaceae bacterium]
MPNNPQHAIVPNNPQHAIVPNNPQHAITPNNPQHAIAPTTRTPKCAEQTLPVVGPYHGEATTFARPAVVSYG